MCWGGSFIIDRLISAGGCLLHIPMESGFASTGTTNSLLELTTSCGLDLNCFGIAFFSLAHSAQFLVANVLTTLIGLPCQMTLQVIPSCWLVGDRVLSQNWVAKSLACDELLDFTNVLLHALFDCLLGFSYVNISCAIAYDFVDCGWISAHVVVVSDTGSPRLVVPWQWFKALRCCSNSEFPWQISLEDLSKFGESVLRHRHSQPLEIKIVFDTIVLVVY